MNSYVLKKFRRIRKKTDYIIIIPSTVLIEDFYIDPIVYNHGKVLTYNIWERYILEDLYKPALPFHYFTERIGEDFYTFKGLPEFQPSYFIEDLVINGIIDRKYLNSAVVVVGENFNLFPLNDRFCEQLSIKALCPLMKNYNLAFARIKFFDECLKENWMELVKDNKTLKYNLHTSKYFDREYLKMYVNKYKVY